MECTDFRQLLRGRRPIVTPVIHVLSTEQALSNLAHTRAAGCPGAFLINHDFPVEPFLPILREVRAACSDFWLGINFLAQPGSIAFPILGQLASEGHSFQAYWADDARIDERTNEQPEADEIARIRAESGWKGLYFGGVAFKKQRAVATADHARAARLAAPYLDIVTTSGIATGEEADVSKTRTFRDALGEAPLALASGITPENAAHYADHVSCFLVATGINHPGDFYNIDPARLARLMQVTQQAGETP